MIMSEYVWWKFIILITVSLPVLVVTCLCTAVNFFLMSLVALIETLDIGNCKTPKWWKSLEKWSRK